MFKKVIFSLVIVFVLQSCVSKKVYQELETKFNKLRTSNTELIKEKDDLVAAKKNLEAELTTLKSDFENLNV